MLLQYFVSIILKVQLCIMCKKNFVMCMNQCSVSHRLLYFLFTMYHVYGPFPTFSQIQIHNAKKGESFNYNQIFILTYRCHAAKL